MIRFFLPFYLVFMYASCRLSAGRVVTETLGALKKVIARYTRSFGEGSISREMRLPSPKEMIWTRYADLRSGLRGGSWLVVSRDGNKWTIQL